MEHSFIPGPVDVDESVLQAQAVQQLPHRSKEFETIFHRAEGNLRKVFYTDHRVLISASSGTGFHEASVRNLVSGKMLACVNGAFSKRFHDVGVTNGKDVTKLDVEWNVPISPELVADALKKDTYDIITVVHNETSTGMVNPIDEIAEAVRSVSPDTLICVDAVSSLSGDKVETDAWGLDVVLTSSQKAFALPPGLAFAAVSDRALEKAATVENRGWYFDFVRMETHRNKNSTAATPAVSLIYALDKQLDRIFEEGLENRFARHAAMAERVAEWTKTVGLDMFSPEGYRSKTVSTVANLLELDFAAMSAFCFENGFRVANGYGDLKGKTFRIAHMGETNLEHVNALLKVLEEFIAKQ